jgi:predicted DNA-binding transcriptional regulator AlpA
MTIKAKDTDFLRTFLSEEQRNEINRRIYTDEPFYDLYTSYSKKLNFTQKALLYDYIKRNRFPKSSKILGAKTVPYYEDEADMLIPEYKWEDVPANEKALLIIKKLEENEK